MISAPRTGVVLSPLKRCCHSAFIFSPCWRERAWMPPNGENAQQGHSWAVRRMGEGEETVLACVHRAEVCECLVTRLCLCISVPSCGHATLWCHLACWRKSQIYASRMTDLMCYYQHELEQAARCLSNSITEHLGMWGSQDMWWQFIFERSNI